MMRSIFAIFPFWIVVVSACSYQKIDIEKQSGKTNLVKKGDKFCISLPEDHASRYLWAMEKNIPTGRVDYMGSVFHGNYVDFNFAAVGKGKEELSFFLYSAKDTLQRKVFVVEVE